MSVSATTPFTFHDLQGMPENGRRYEVIDGQILVKATPGLYHQEVVAELWMLLSGACPDGDLAVVGGPFAVRPDLYTEVHPDVLVAERAELVEKDLTTRPALAVEVLADSGRLIDRVLKRAAYQAMGTRSYWIVDPDVPDLVVPSSTRRAGTSRWPGSAARRCSRHGCRSRCGWCRTSCWAVSVRRGGDRPELSVLRDTVGKTDPRGDHDHHECQLQHTLHGPRPGGNAR